MVSVTTIPVSVAGGVTQRVSLDGSDHPGLHLTKPRLWWPVGYGTPELYSLQVRVNAGNNVSDERTIRFGVREVTSDLTSEGYRLYLINHRPILIRGAGWARNLFFMETAKREEQEMRLVRDMGLNAVRFEGKLGSDHLLDLADENGVFVIPGFCCCDYWEQWSQWDDATKALAVASLHDQLLLLRNHPSVLTFWYGSDKFAPPEVEREYLKVIEQTEWPNPTVASAGKGIPQRSVRPESRCKALTITSRLHTGMATATAPRSASQPRLGPARPSPAWRTCAGCSATTTCGRGQRMDPAQPGGRLHSLHALR
jgi:exo-1,4-beta-D-glucosaminidase